MIFIFKIIEGFIRLQIEVGFTIVAVHRFDEDSVRHGKIIILR